MSEEFNMKNTAKIKGGYIILARIIQDSEISHAPPHVREIWIYLLRKAFHTDGNVLERGQLLQSVSDIREGLAWQVGFRKERYSTSQCENAMKWLRKAGMIDTHKTTRGCVITIVKYNQYQNPANYKKGMIAEPIATHVPEDCRTIDNNDIKRVKEYTVEIPVVINYLNSKTGSKYKTNTVNTVSLLTARLKDGYTVEDCKKVIDVKVADWKDTENEKWLRPETLFGNKFEGYVNQKIKTKVIDKNCGLPW